MLSCSDIVYCILCSIVFKFNLYLSNILYIPYALDSLPFKSRPLRALCAKVAKLVAQKCCTLIVSGFCYHCGISL